MSHRKFEAPRHGHLGFLPRKRSSTRQGRIRSFPKDDPKAAPHLTAFMGFKGGMTHVVRDLDRPGSKLHKKEIVEPVTILETPPMTVVGVTGYKRTPSGLVRVGTAFAQTLPEAYRRTFYKNFVDSKQKAFTKYAELFNSEEGKAAVEARFQAIRDSAEVVRVIAHSNPSRIAALRMKKGNVMEIQVNGGASAEEKVAFAQGLFEKEIKVSDVFAPNECLDTIAVTRGSGFQGVTHRWGTKKLPRKTHKGLRKVACIGAWHPSRVGYSVPRAGQHGYHHRTETNKKIYRMGKAAEEDPANGRGAADLTDKTITPMGGFPKFGVIKNDFLVIKGSTPGPTKRPVALRKSMHVLTEKRFTEDVTLKLIDTTSKRGHGKFQTFEEKAKFVGPLKKDLIRQEAAKSA